MVINELSVIIVIFNYGLYKEFSQLTNDEISMNKRFLDFGQT